MKAKRGRPKKKVEPKGLGDTIEQITEATGIKAVVHSIWGNDCGCDERKAKLNKLFPYRRNECINEDEYIYLKDFFNRENKSIVTDPQQRELLKIYNRIFNDKKTFTTCSPCIRTIVLELQKIYNSYE